MAKRKKNGSDTNGRQKRPELPRSEPIRSWQGIFGSVPNGASSWPGLPSGPAAEAVQRGVETGYRIMQDSLREGAKVASSFMNPSRTGAAPGPEVPQIFTRLFQNAADLNATWLDMFNMMTGMNGQRAASSAPNTARTNDSPEGAPPTVPNARSRVSLSVHSTRPTEIIFTLDDASSERFLVENLRRRGSKDAIRDVKLDAPSEPGGPLRIHLRVPAELSPGRYTGAILNDATKQPAGRVTVVVGAAESGE